MTSASRVLVRAFGFAGLVLSGWAALSGPACATELKQRTANAFEHYVQLTEARIQNEVNDPGHFLYFDSFPDEQKQAMLERLRSGQVVVLPMRTKENGKDMEVPDGMVHHWLAIGFLPGVTLEQVLALAEDYKRHAQVYAPDVQRAELLDHEGQHDTVLFRFHRTAVITVVYNVKFDIDYTVPDSGRAYSTSQAVRVAEVQNAGKPDEKELPVGNDHGYLWRLNLYTRYVQADGGVYVQIEFLALSRSVPLIWAWLVNPYVRSVPRDYLTHYVVATRKGLTAEDGK